MQHSDKPWLTPPTTTSANGAQVDDRRWQRGHITIPMKNGTEQKWSCRVLGGLAVLRGENNQLWRLSNQTTGLLICTVTEEAEALKIGEFLHDRCGAAFGHSTKQDVCDDLPLWVIPWIRACRREHAWVNPVPYLNREITE